MKLIQINPLYGFVMSLSFFMGIFSLIDGIIMVASLGFLRGLFQHYFAEKMGPYIERRTAQAIYKRTQNMIKKAAQNASNQ